MRHADAWHRATRWMVTLARAACRDTSVLAFVPPRVSDRVHRCDRRPGCYRGGPPALASLWPASNGPTRLAVPDEPRRRNLAAGLHDRLSHHVSIRTIIDAAYCTYGAGVFGWRRCKDRGWQARSPRAGRRGIYGGARTMIHVLDFVPIWTLILGMAVFFYVLLDGFDLGVGILYGFAPNAAARNVLMNSIAPVWDGNETWLVFGGLGLFAAFPLAFAIIIPAVYFPILVMLLALVFRGVAFEFRFRDSEHKTVWDYAFSFGSGVATFAQGMVLGSIIQGFQVSDRIFAGSSFDFLTPFSILTGF